MPQLNSLALAGRRNLLNRIALLATLAVSAGCDPNGALYLDQTVTPVVADTCVRAALTSSPLVSRITSSDLAGKSFALELRDSTVRRFAWPPSLSVLSFPAIAPVDSAHINITFRLPGKMTFMVTNAESSQLNAIGSQLVAAVRDACHMSSSTQVSCRVTGMWWSKKCAPAG